MPKIKRTIIREWNNGKNCSILSKEEIEKMKVKPRKSTFEINYRFSKDLDKLIIFINDKNVQELDFFELEQRIKKPKKGKK